MVCVIEDIRNYERGLLDEPAITMLFQHLVNTGEVWLMSAQYQTQAIELANSRCIVLPNFGSDTTYFYGQ